MSPVPLRRSTGVVSLHTPGSMQLLRKFLGIKRQADAPIQWGLEYDVGVDKVLIMLLQQ